MNTENLETLKIHRLTQAQYDRELAAGNIDENALYLTPDTAADLSGYATIEQLNEKSDIFHTHEIDDVNNLQISLDELLETSKSYTDEAISTIADENRTHTIADIENLQTTLDAKVSTGTTINEKPLSSDIVLSAADVGADVIGSANTALENAKSYADTLVSGKADISHTHDDIYYTEDEIDSKVSNINTSISNIINGTTVVAEATHASTADSATSANSATKAIQDGNGNIIISTYETKADAGAKLAEAKTYADGIKNDLLNGAGSAYDTLKELGDLIDDNKDAIDALEIVASGKANADHNHNSDYDAKGSATTAVDTHNASTTAHNDIRQSINSLQTEVNNNLTTHTNNKSNPHGVTLSQLGVNATATELNNMAGVTSNVQTQLDGKSNTFHTHDGYMASTNPVGTGSFSMNRKAGTTVANMSSTLGVNCTASNLCAHAQGNGTTASGNISHAEGQNTTASAKCSHAEGYDTTASGINSHAEGQSSKATATDAHAEGHATEANGQASHSEGWGTIASGEASHAAGYYTTANNYQYVVGKYNATRNPIASVDTVYNTSDSVTTTYPALFIVGNGTGDTSRSNAFTVYANGKCKGLSSFGSSGADYARQYEWLDGNPNNEDRRGLLVILDGSKIRIATPDDDIEDCEGIVSTCPAFVENDPDEWHDRYLKDVFGRRITQEVIIPEEIITKSVEKIDEETGKVVTEEVTEVIPEHTTVQFVVNPEYDPEQEYICRDVRPEWTVVGFSGFIVAVDDGTCQVNGYCTVGENGVLTMSETRTAYRVMERKDDNHILVRIK